MNDKNRIIHLFGELKRHNIDVSLDGDDLDLSFDGAAIDSELLNKIRSNKDQIIEFLRRYDSASRTNETIPVATKSENYPLSNAQLRLWLTCQLEESSVAYNMPGSIELDSEIDLESFKEAIYSVVDRHEILRTIFKENEQGEIRQYILSIAELGFKIDFQDYCQLEDPDIATSVYIQKDSDQPFELDKGPLLRASLLRLDSDRYIFYYNLHHIISDGWSMDVLARDVMSYYEAIQARMDLPAPLRIQYKDYTIWQKEDLEDAHNNSIRTYWQSKFSYPVSTLDLPSIKKRPLVKTYNGRKLGLHLSKELIRPLRDFSIDRGGSLFTGLLAVWKVLFYRYTGERDITIGNPVAGREYADLKDQIGFYVNTLALRNEINPSNSFIEWYDQLKQSILEAYEHQSYPYDKLLEDLDLVRDTSRNPLFDIKIDYHGTVKHGLGLRAEDGVVDLGKCLSKFDLEIDPSEFSEGVDLLIKYNSDIYEKSMVVGLLNHFKSLLQALMQNVHQRIGEVDFLSEGEQLEQLETFNKTEVLYEEGQTIVEKFEKIVQDFSFAEAIVCGDLVLTYQQLAEKSDKVMRYLENCGVVPGDIVGICQSRSESAIASILGIIKSGAAYLPIDVDAPLERIEYMLGDSNAKWVISERDLLYSFGDENEGVIYIEDIEKADLELTPVKKNISGDDLLYVIYTSGSTGRPKGVGIQHKSVVNYINHQVAYFGIEADESILLFSNVAFDASVEQIFLPLLTGAKLVVPTKEILLDQKLFIALLIDKRISHLHAVPSFLRTLNHNSAFSLKRIISAGEAFDASVWEEWAGKVDIFNKYGPTEATISVIEHQLTERTEGLYPIGKPISNTQVYILDETLKIVPKGVKGEICISGMGLSPGYINDEIKTRQKFVDHPYQEGERLYRTGDYGVWMDNGLILYQGRKDHQVKIRGYRIELGEIEAVLNALHNIEKSAVIAKTDNHGEKQLIAYVVSKELTDSRSIKDGLILALEEVLPSYMVPTIYVTLDQMPLTSSGKVNRRALPLPDEESYHQRQEYKAPSNGKQIALVKVMESVLKIERIGISDNFFDLGGDSIKSIQIVSRLREKGFSIKVGEILTNPILENMALLLNTVSREIDQSEVEGEVYLTPIQWSFLNESGRSKLHHFNQSILLKSKERVDHQALEKSVATLIRHHDALRMTYQKDHGVWKQYNNPFTSRAFRIDYHDLTDHDQAVQVMEELCTDLQGSLDLSKGPLFIVGHFSLPDGDRLALICHHLVIDGVSWRVILEDLATLYQSFKQTKKGQLPRKTDSFQRWTTLLHEYAISEKLQSEYAYWESIQKSVVPDFFVKDQLLIGGKVHDKKQSFLLDKTLTNLLQTKVHRVYRTEINDLLLTSLGLALKETFGVGKTIIELEGHGREDILEAIDISRTVGWFTTLYPFVLDVEGDKEDTRNLIEVKEASRRVPEKGIGYGIIKYLDQGFSSSCKPSIKFNYLGDFGDGVNEKGETAIFEYGTENIGPNQGEEMPSSTLLDISGLQAGGALQMTISYSSEMLDSELIGEFMESYRSHLSNLILNLSDQKECYLTPSDLTYTDLSVEQVNFLNIRGQLEDAYGLSPTQEGMYFHWLSSNEHYFEQIAYRLKWHGLKIETVKAAYDRLVARYSILRTSFTDQYEGLLLQIVKKSVPSNFSYDLCPTECTGDEIEAWVSNKKRADLQQGFDLHGPSQMRLTVLDLGNDEYVFIWSHHHILMDGWCASILINDFYQILRSIEGGKILDLPAAKPYSSYIKWLNKVDKDNSLSYWKKYLSGYEIGASIPFEYQSTKNESDQIGSKSFVLNENRYEKLISYCKQQGITINTFLSAAWGYLLSRYNNTQDVVFGSVVSGRPAELEGIENMVGLFITTIPVRVSYEGDQTVEGFILKIQAEAVEGLPHHYVGLAAIQSVNDLDGTLFDHILIFENYPVQEQIEEQLEGDQYSNASLIAPVDVQERTNYDLNIKIVQILEDALKIDFDYNRGLYADAAIEMMILHFQNIINAFLNSPKRALASIEYLTGEEKEQLFNQFNLTTTDFPAAKTVVELYQDQVRKNPNNIALSYGKQEFTFRQLDEKSNLVAALLQTQGVLVGDLIPICVERSPEMIMGVLGILKAGGAYVPIDPDYPVNRIDLMLSDIGASFVLTQTKLKGLFDHRWGEDQNIYLDQELAQKHLGKGGKVILRSTDLAYVMYTSGSTGQPKGVLVSHQNIVRLVKATNYYEFSERDTLLATGSFSFDATTFEFWGPLLNGGQLVLCPKSVLLDVEALQQEIQMKGVNIMWFTVGWFNELVETKIDVFKNLETILVGGDRLSPGHITKVKSAFDHLKLINGYGPTENTTFSLTYAINGVSGEIPIGKPISNGQAYLLDDFGMPQALGAIGEIYLGGAGLSRGYLNQPELTAAKFIKNPFDGKTLLYRTGDLGKYDHRGNIVFMGRKDEQVKIRGYRIELGEIESVLEKITGIKQSVVIARTLEGSAKQLIAYVVYESDQTSFNPEAHLRTLLPDYMVPKVYVNLDKIPLTSNGKVNRQALPQPDLSNYQRSMYIAPETEVEKTLVEVCESVLDLSPISIMDNFYNLGGDSIKSIQIVARMRQRGYSLKVGVVLANPILKDMVTWVTLAKKRIDQKEIQGEVPLTPIQHYFFKDSGVRQFHHFNQSVLLKSSGRLNNIYLEQSIKALLKHHDALRLIFEEKDGQWLQKNLSYSDALVEVYNHDLREEISPEQKMEDLCQALQEGFDLGSGPLFVAAHFRFSAGDRLALICHHLIVDGVSWRILLEDLSQLYRTYESNGSEQLPLKTDAYQSWALELQAYASNQMLQKERLYWERLLNHFIPEFPIDKKRKKNQPVILDNSKSFSLDEETTTLMQTAVHHVYNTEVNDLLLASLGLAVRDTFEVKKSVISLEGHGREDILAEMDISRTVGWFTTIYPIILEVESSSNPVRSLIRIKDDLRKIPNKGIGYGILKYLTKGFSAELQPTFQFNYLGDFGRQATDPVESKTFTMASEPIGSAVGEKLVSPELFKISGILVDGELQLSIQYCSNLYTEERVGLFIRSYEAHLRNLIASLVKEEHQFLTPSDLTYKELDYDEVEALNADGLLEDVYELSPAQEGMFFHWLSGENFYFEQFGYRIQWKDLPVDLLKEAYDDLVNRYAILRTSFTDMYAGSLLQIVKKSVPSGFRLEAKPSEIDSLTLESWLKERKRADKEAGFDLESGSQMRLTVIDLGGDQFEFIWSFHHILMDGWCTSILINEFYQLLNAKAQGSPLRLPPAQPYAAYISWLNKSSRAESLTYWKDYLRGYDQVAELPYAKANYDTEQLKKGTEIVRVSGRLHSQLENLCTSLGITMNTLVESVWGFLLSRYNSTNDVVFGAVVSGRPGELEGVEEMVGLFINTVPIRVHYTSKDTPEDLLKKVQENAINSLPHHYISLATVQQQSELGLDLLNHILVFENYPVQKKIEEQLTDEFNAKAQLIAPVDVEENTNYDFSIKVLEAENLLEVHFMFNEARFYKDGMQQLALHFQNVLDAFISYSNDCLSAIDFLTEKEKTEQLNVFNATEVAYPKEETLIDLFWEQVKANGTKGAVYYGEECLTYAELDFKSNQLAQCLIEDYGIKKGDYVGVHLERSERYIVSLLGILKAGGVYLPIDTKYPKDRKAYILEDAGVRLLLSGSEQNGELDNYEGDLLNIDRVFKTFDHKDSANLPEVTPGDLAYVIYTSGSTGKPKGVEIEHGGILNTMRAQIAAFGIQAAHRGLEFASFSFDASISETFMILLSGGTLYIADEGMRSDPALLEEYLLKHQIDVATLPPSYFQLMSNAGFKHFKVLLTAGEAPDYGRVASYLTTGGAYYNAYGPTEASICATVYQLRPGVGITGDNIPIGTPISNVRIYILDEYGKFLPKGSIGEICIGGPGLARGYLNRPALTAEKFISDPYRVGERLYRTGDLGRWTAGGQLEFKGRRDAQVKINGNRVELGEIESQLTRLPGIKQSVVQVLPTDGEASMLVAYVVNEMELKVQEIRNTLGKSLPDYMVPQRFVQLEALPLTVNGKVDRKALPEPSERDYEREAYVAPATEKEKVLVEVCESVLGIRGIGMQDNFYNLGGDSIKSILLASRLRQHGYTVKVGEVLAHPVLTEMLPRIELTTQGIDQGEVTGRVPLTAIQRYFFEDSGLQNLNHFNQPVLLRSREAIDRGALEQSIEALLKHHDALRLTYTESEPGQWEQFNQPYRAGSSRIEFYDLREERAEREKLGEIGSVLQASLDLQKGPLLVVGHFKLSDGDRLALICHHLVVDGISWRILLEDLSTLYTQHLTNSEIALPLKTDAFQSWSIQLEEYANGVGLTREKQYWSALESRLVPTFPMDKASRRDQCLLDEQVSFRLSKAQTKQLQTQVHGIYSTEINDILLTGLGLAIREVLGVEQTWVNLEGHGREDILPGLDISRTVGWFSSFYPILLDVGKEEDVKWSLIRVKDDLRKIPNKGVGYSILKYLREDFTIKLQQSVKFNYLGDFGGERGQEDKDDASPFAYSSEYIGASVGEQTYLDSLWSVSGLIVSGQLHLSIGYGSANYQRSTLEALAKAYEEHLVRLIMELSAMEGRRLTPADLTYPHLNLDTLAVLNKGGNLEDVYPLSPAQQGMYYHWLSSSDYYFEQIGYRVQGSGLRLDALKKASDALVARYAILRTYFTSDYGDTLLQVVERVVPSRFIYKLLPVELRTIGEREAWVLEQKQEDRNRGFDLGQPSQMRLTVLDLGQDTYELIWSIHHILMDGWCASILINDFYKILQNTEEKGHWNLPAVVPYAHYIKWLGGVDEGATLNYWRDYLAGYTKVAQVPKKGGVEVRPGYDDRKAVVELRGKLYEKLVECCQSLGITINTFVEVAWGYLLSRYNDTNDVVFGSVVSGRPADLQGVEHMVGLFLNTVPVRIQYEEREKLIEVLKRRQAEAIGALPHHYVSLATVQGQSELGVSLVDHIMVFENYPVQEQIAEQLGGNGGQMEEHFRVESVEVRERSNYDLSIIVQVKAKSLKVSFRYDQYQFSEGLMGRLGNHLYQIMESFVVDWDQPLGRVSYLPETEQAELLALSKGESSSIGSIPLYLNLFTERVAQTPRATAVVASGQSISYERLDALSNQLGHCLRERGLKKEELVGVCLERSVDQLVAILGILKAGGAYLPLDPTYPPARIRFMLADSGVRLVISNATWSSLTEEGRVEPLYLDRLEYKSYPADLLEVHPGANDLMYVIYTSGSTGKPKGVQITQGALGARMAFYRDYYALSVKDRMLYYRSFSFDGAIEEYLLPFAVGATCVVAPKGFEQDLYHQLVAAIAEHRITKVNMPPILLRTVLEVLETQAVEQLSSLRHVVSGGDKLSVETVRQFQDRVGRQLAVRLYNSYGPTENTIDSTIAILDAEGAKPLSGVPIGKPVGHGEAYVLDRQGQLLPKGIQGQICVAGAGLARGYLNDPALTAAKFVAHPFNVGARLYQTGDLGRWQEDGQLEFLGRVDHQVKIRGYRIELGEIETALDQLTAIKQSVVEVRETESGTKELLAYVVIEADDLDENEVQDQLAERLPTYMIPRIYTILEAIPLTPIGKVDRRSLPIPTVDRGQEGAATRHLKRAERVLVGVWKSVLGKAGVGPQSNYYQLGGDSIKSILIASRLKRKGYELSVTAVLTHPILADMADQLRPIDRLADQGMVKGPVGLTWLQREQLRYWEEPESELHYTMRCLRSNELLVVEALKASLEGVLQHHDALRMVFERKEDDWQQTNKAIDSVELSLTFQDWRTESKAAILRLLEEARSSYDPQTSPVLSVWHVRLSQTEDLLVFRGSSLILDDVSWRVLLNDFCRAYDQYQAGQPIDLGPKTDAFQRWVPYLNQLDDKAYWEGSIAMNSSKLPTDFEAKRGWKPLDISMTRDLSEELRLISRSSLHQVYRTKIADWLLTSLRLALEEVLGLARPSIGVEQHQRPTESNTRDWSRTIGAFDWQYPLHFQKDYGDGYVNHLVATKDQWRQIPNNGLGYANYAQRQGESMPQVSFLLKDESHLGALSLVSPFTSSDLLESMSESVWVPRGITLRVVCQLVGDQLTLCMFHNSAIYQSETIRQLGQAFQAQLRGLIDAVLPLAQMRALTPSDLSYPDLSFAEVQALDAEQDLVDVYALSPTQEGMYYHWLAGDQLYYIQMAYRLKWPDLQMDRLKGAYDTLVDRYDILRTSFSNQYGQRVLQVVRKRVPSSFRYIRWEGTGDLDAWLRARKKEDEAAGFDLSGPSQMRLTVLDLGQDRYELIWSYHHILMDGWCTGILLNDFYRFLGQPERGKTRALPAVVPYARYIKWLSRVDEQATLTYWRQYLKGYREIAKVPFTRPQRLEEHYAAGREQLVVRGSTYEGLQALCTRMGITKNTFLEVIWGFLLARYNNVEDVVFGTVVSGRPGQIEGVEDIVGLFVNTIPVRIQFQATDSIRDLLHRAQSQAIAGLPHHYASLAQVQAQSELGMALLNHILVYENFYRQELEVPELLGGQLAETMVEASVSNDPELEKGRGIRYDFDLTVVEGKGELILSVNYDKNKYDEGMLKRLAVHLDNLVQCFVKDPDQRLGTIDYLAAAEKQELVTTFNVLRPAPERYESVMEGFRAQAKRSGKDKALVFEGEVMTYEELDIRSNQLAHYLLGQGVQANDLVPLYLQRGPAMIVGIFGILKAGAAYVPIDDGYPAERLRFILEDIGACMILTDRALLDTVKEVSPQLSTILLDDWALFGADMPVEVPQIANQAQDLAYVMYTSGTTGKPKGVMISNGTLADYTQTFIEYFNFNETDRVLQQASISFDTSIEEIYPTLLRGGQLHIGRAINDFEDLLNICEREQITLTSTHPYLIQYINENHHGRKLTLRAVINGGDVLKRSHIQDLVELCPVYNSYGPTEGTGSVSCATLNKGFERITIGQPLANKQLYVLNDALELLPVGAIGELCIGGPSIAEGYLNRPALTAEKFVHIGPSQTERVYRTGDLARWLPGGELEFIGRKDNQVKIRNYRVELGEIEATLDSLDQVRESVVLAVDEKAGGKKLVAYLVGPAVEIASVQASLRHKLPEYMVPSTFMVLEQMPVTANGKIDRRALPSPTAQAKTYVAPTTDTEKALVAIWREVLEMERIGIEDNFFELGGNSLSAIKILLRIRKGLQTDVELKSLFEFKTIAEIALHIDFSKQQESIKANPEIVKQIV